MITWAASLCRGRAHEAKAGQIKLINEEINHADQPILANPVLKPIWEKNGLAAINSFNKTCHALLSLTCGSLPQRAVSTKPWPKAVVDAAECERQRCALQLVNHSAMSP